MSSTIAISFAPVPTIPQSGDFESIKGSLTTLYPFEPSYAPKMSSRKGMHYLATIMRLLSKFTDKRRDISLINVLETVVYLRIDTFIACDFSVFHLTPLWEILIFTGLRVIACGRGDRSRVTNF